MDRYLYEVTESMVMYCSCNGDTVLLLYLYTGTAHTTLFYYIKTGRGVKLFQERKMNASLQNERKSTVTDITNTISNPPLSYIPS